MPIHTATGENWSRPVGYRSPPKSTPATDDFPPPHAGFQPNSLRHAGERPRRLPAPSCWPGAIDMANPDPYPVCRTGPIRSVPKLEPRIREPAIFRQSFRLKPRYWKRVVKTVWEENWCHGCRHTRSPTTCSTHRLTMVQRMYEQVVGLQPRRHYVAGIRAGRYGRESTRFWGWRCPMRGPETWKALLASTNRARHDLGRPTEGSRHRRAALYQKPLTGDLERRILPIVFSPSKY